MKKKRTLFACALLIFCLSSFTQAAETVMVPDEDGVLQDNEYEVLTTNGALTRRLCPFTCEMRGLPREHCKEWRSKDDRLCYVWDTRLPQNAVPLDGEGTSAR